MFFKRKAREKEKRDNEKLVRKVLGKDARRRVFGFQCSPQIQVKMKSLADQIHVPLFALAEHGLQLGAIQIGAAVNDPEEREVLRRHLSEVHVGMRTIEKVARYDEEASEMLNTQRIIPFDIDKSAHLLAAKFMRWGRQPQELEELILIGHYCKMAMAQGWSAPPGFSSGSYSHRPSNSVNKQQPDDPQNNPPEQSE
jgi:hypothetical protein